MAQKFKGDVRIDGEVLLPNETAQRAVEIDASGNLKSSTVTSTELARVSGVTSNIQDQLDDKINLTEKGAANGVASLDAGGKVPVSQLPNSIMEYLGTWNASTNTPTLADGTGNAGDVYITSVAGTQDLGSGNITFAQGDWIVYNGSTWEKSVNSNAVASVNSQTGAVVLDSDDIAEGSTNLYHTDERAQDAVGTILVDSSSIDFTYNDGTPSITAVVLPAGVDHDQLQNFSANEHIDHSTVSIATASDSGLQGGGDLTATRNLSVDITGLTAETSIVASDEVMVYDASATALRKATKENLTKLENNVSLKSRNAANSADVEILKVNTSNQVQFVNIPLYSGSPLVNQTSLDEQFAQKVPFKLPVKVVAITNIDISTFDVGVDTIDATTVSNGDRVLLTGQTDNTENGIYVLDDSGSPELVRASDFTLAESILGARIPVLMGSGEGKVYRVEAPNDPSAGFAIDTDPISIILEQGVIEGTGTDVTAGIVSVDITNAGVLTSADGSDLILIADASDSNTTKRITRANFLAGISAGSAGDIAETSFSGANNQASPANITGFVFGAGVRGFEGLVTATVVATANLYETFTIKGIKKASAWEITVSSVGDESLVAFSIDSSGQLQYTSGNYAGFTSLTLKFRAITLGV